MRTFIYFAFRIPFFLVLSASLMLAGILSPAHAQNSEGEISSNLKRIREQIERDEERLQGLKVNQRELQTSVDQLTAEANKAAEQKDRILQSVEDLKLELDRMNQTVAKFQHDLENRKHGLRSRAVALYKTQRRTVALDYLFSAQSSNDLLKRTRYLTAVANYDRNYMQGLRKLVESVARDQKQLDSLQAKKRENLEKAQALESDLRKKREQKAMLAAEEREKVKQQEKSLDKLRASAAKFELLLSSIMGGDRYVTPPEDKTPSSEDIPSKIEPTPPSHVEVQPFSGSGLAALRGKLSFPVPGELVQRFGKQKHDEFADMLFVKGLEIRSPLGAKVKSVAAGKVVLSQVLPGYGNVIIVDHGERYYTLYGRLAGSLKSVGQVVKAGEEIAVLGEADYKGRNFYFELRIKGKATNPIDFFRDAPQMSST